MTAAVRQHDLQGNILCGYGRQYRFGLFLFLRVGAPGAAAAWLGALADRVTTALSWRAQPCHTLNVAVTHAGLRALGVPGTVLDRFPEDFRVGMEARRDRLGDAGPSAPELWEPSLRNLHVLVTVTAVDERTRNRERAALADEVVMSGFEVAAAQDTAFLPDDREHFGFRDGISQPAIRDPKAGPERRTPAQVEIRPGEFVLGYRDEGGTTPPVPPLGLNGSYLVVRKLAQDVEGFAGFLRAEAGAERERQELLAAKLIGRWRDGTPLVLSKDKPRPELAQDLAWANEFGYAHDPGGLRCPIGAHIRRTNPRDALDRRGRLSRRHRIIRRGMSYEPARAGERPGLMFACYQASIARQFEFVQSQWCNDGDAFGLGDDPDALGGRSDGKQTLQGTPPSFVPVRSFVTVRGGDYFLAPGLGALREIARLAG